MDPSKRRGSAKQGPTIGDTKKRRAEKATENTRRRREIMVRSRREGCPEADALYDRYEDAKKEDAKNNNTTAVTAWRAELIQAYRGCKYSNSTFETCVPSVDGDLMDILAELKVQEKQMQLGGGKMVGGNNPINQLIALNSWIAKKEGWTSCTKWLLTLIWEKCCKIYGYLYDGIGDAIGIIKDVGLTALGDTKTETFKFTANAFYYLYSAGYEGIEAAALQAHPYFNAIENHFKNILVENKGVLAAKLPDVTPQQFQEWLDNTSMVNKIYWTLVTLKSYQAGPLLAATLSTAGSIVVSASYYGVLMAYYITSNNYFTLALLTSAAAKTGYDKLSIKNQQKILAMGNKLDEFISDMILGAEVSPLTSMMDEIKDLPDKAKLVALKQANLQKKLTKTILTNAETNAELSEILKSKEIEAKIAEVEAETKQIQAQIESFEKKIDTEDIERDLGGDAPGEDLGGEDLDLGGKRRTRKRGKRHSKRAPRKIKTLRKKRRGKK